jgi:hypothetical protein
VPHCEPGAVPSRVGSVLAVPERKVESTGAELVKRCQPLGCQRAGEQAASPTPADGRDAANLPRAQDEEPVEEVKAPLVQEGTHLRLRNVKREANRQH